MTTNNKVDTTDILDTDEISSPQMSKKIFRNDKHLNYKRRSKQNLTSNRFLDFISNRFEKQVENQYV